jgi:NitT/TauT family transport system substrate-binding protein
MFTRARATALLSAGFAAAAFPIRVGSQEKTTVRVAVTPSADGAAVHYADEMGFFAKAGLNVDIQTMQNNPAIATAVISGAIGIGHGGVDTLAQSHSKNIPLVIIAPAGEYISPQMLHIAGLFVPTTSPARVPKDLNGKVAGVASLNGLTATSIRVLIDQNGGDSSTLKFFEMPIPAMAASLATGRIDAAYISEPYVADARKNGRAIAYGMDGIAKHFLVTAWFASAPWAQAHPDIVVRFAAAMHQTAVWANHNEDKADAIFTKYSKVEPAVLATMTRGHFAEQFTPALLQPFIDVSAKYNGFSPFPAQDLMYRPGA